MKIELVGTEALTLAEARAVVAGLCLALDPDNHALTYSQFPLIESALEKIWTVVRNTEELKGKQR